MKKKIFTKCNTGEIKICHCEGAEFVGWAEHCEAQQIISRWASLHSAQPTY